MNGKGSHSSRVEHTLCLQLVPGKIPVISSERSFSGSRAGLEVLPKTMARPTASQRRPCWATWTSGLMMNYSGVVGLGGGGGLSATRMSSLTAGRQQGGTTEVNGEWPSWVPQGSRLPEENCPGGLASSLRSPPFLPLICTRRGS